jgi:hypothetical protein
MFSLVTAPAGTCCGNREKGPGVKNTLTPQKPGAANADAPVDGEETGLPAALTDGAAASLGERQISGESLDKQPNSGRLQMELQSFEDRTHNEAKAEGELSDDSHDSDEEMLQKCAQNLRTLQKKLVMDIKGKKDASAHDSAILDATRGSMDEMKESVLIPKRPGRDSTARSQTNASIGSMTNNASAMNIGERLGSANSVLATGQSGMLARGMTSASIVGMDSMNLLSTDGAVDLMPTLADSNQSRSHENLGALTRQGTFASNNQPQPEPDTRAQEEEEEDENENPDDEKVINRKYEKRYPVSVGEKTGMEAKVEELRGRCMAMGDEEPPDMVMENGQKTSKARVLEVIFEDRSDMFDVEKRKVVFKRRPLGMKWDKRMPITICGVTEGSHADILNVKQGYIVKEINGYDVTHDKYRDVHKRLMKAVEVLPDMAPAEEDEASKLLRAAQGQVLTTRVTVTLKAARGFQNDEADHFCVCAIPGKPHSRVQTGFQCVLDTPLTPDLDWNETFEIFDYQRGDSIEFGVFARETVVCGKTTFDAVTQCLEDGTMTENELQARAPKIYEMVILKKTSGMKALVAKYPGFFDDSDDEEKPTMQAANNGEESSLGRVLLGWDAFSAKGFDGELTLVDPRTGHPTKTKMKVQVQVDMIPEKQQAISTFRRCMRDRLLALNLNEKDVNGSIPEREGQNTFASASDAVRESLRAYHKHSEAMGVFMPFPGTGVNDGFSELEPEDNRKLLDYNRKLNNDEIIEKLWVTTKEKLHKRTGPCPGCGKKQCERIDEIPFGMDECMLVEFSEADIQRREKAAAASKLRNNTLSSKMTGSSTGEKAESRGRGGFWSMFKGGSFMRKGSADARADSKFAEALHANSQVIDDGLEIVFEDPKGAADDKIQSIRFERGPLGIEFFKYIPLQVRSFRPGSIAEEKGVAKGWKIIKVDGVDITECRYKEAHRHLVSSISKLPT